jgi:exodeoxyribonuclease VII large subunit
LSPSVLLNRIEAKRRALDGQGKLLVSLSYHSVLARGYAVVRDSNGAMVRAAAGLSAGALLDIEFRDDHIGAEVTSTGSPTRGGTAPTSATAPRPDPGIRVPQRRQSKDQGTLF